MTRVWAQRATDQILGSLGLECRSALDGNYVVVFARSGPLWFTEGQIRRRTLPVVQAICVGFGLCPTMAQRERAARSIDSIPPKFVLARKVGVPGGGDGIGVPTGSILMFRDESPEGWEFIREYDPDEYTPPDHSGSREG